MFGVSEDIAERGVYVLNLSGRRCSFVALADRAVLFFFLVILVVVVSATKALLSTDRDEVSNIGSSEFVELLSVKYRHYV